MTNPVNSKTPPKNFTKNSQQNSQQNSHSAFLLDQVNTPKDLKQFSIDEIKQISNELREETIANVAKTGGHLGAGLGVVELTCALHYVFDTPSDKLIWDVGHQAYPHKILTGRRKKMSTIRKPNGLSGFTRREESEYDPFGAGHSSTSISAGLGISVAKKFKQEKSHVIAVIGDGAMSAGMAFEAMNNAGALEEQYFIDNRLIVILNDNDMSIAPPTGAMSHYFSRLASSKSYLKIRDISKKFVHKLPNSFAKYPRKFEKSIKEWWMGGNIFEELGFYYIGPIDGHNLDILIPILQNIRDDKSSDPILIHCVTQKGKGLTDKMQSSDKLHAVSCFDPSTGIQQKSSSQYPTFSKIFGTKLTELANNDDKILAITAAMPSGTGLDIFAKNHSHRTFDVGIAEQHAVTFSAGLASEGMKPFCAIYSTFLQRAYDQIIHDVALQKLAVRFAIDRAGYVGADGPTHAGSFDIAYLANIPNFVVMAPSCGQELIKMINTAQAINHCPSAFRFPRAEAKNIIDFNDNEILEIGKSKVVQEGQKVAILSLGTIIENIHALSSKLNDNYGFKPTIIDARFAKPFDEIMIKNLINHHQILITIEEGVIGGFGSLVANFIHSHGLIDNGKCKFRSLFMADKFIEQNDIDEMRNQGNLGVNYIFEQISKLLKN